MTINLDTLFPHGVSNETASAISDLLNDIAYQWDSAYYFQISRYQKRCKADVSDVDPKQPWHKKQKI